MRQRTFPCCRKPMNYDDVMYALQESIEAGSPFSSCPTFKCPNCQTELTAFLEIERVDAL